MTRIRDRRFVVVDPERGLAFAFGFFDHAAGKRARPDSRWPHGDGWTCYAVDLGNVGSVSR